MIPAVILAGGRSTRLGGGAKCLLELGGGTILDRVIGCLRGQAGPLMINSNHGAELFAGTGLEVRADILAGWLGPLAGIHAGMIWARETGADAVLSVPGDTPFLPADLVARLEEGRAAGQAAIAVSGGEMHPVVGIWPCALAEALEAHLAGEEYRVRGWLGRIDFRAVEFAASAIDPFWNVNTPEDLALARAMAGAA